MNGGQQPEQQPIEQWAEQYISAFQPVTEMIERLFTIYGEAGNAMMQTFAQAMERATQDGPPQED
jgi:hypothetical protein